MDPANQRIINDNTVHDINVIECEQPKDMDNVQIHVKECEQPKVIDNEHTKVNEYEQPKYIDKEPLNVNECGPHKDTDNHINNCNTLQDITITKSLDESVLIENPEDFIDQVNILQDDIEADVFMLNVQTGKRSAKHKVLKEESFDFTVYKQKQCGFTTCRPMFWLKTIDEYIKTNDSTFGKYYYKLDKKTDKYFMIKIHICYQITKKVVLTVNLLTGIIMVKGENFANWIEDEFPKFRCDGDEIFKDIDAVIPEGEKDDDLGDYEKEIATLWQYSTANKTSILNLDGTLKQICDEFNLHANLHGNVKEDVNRLLSENLKFDAKLNVFMETTTKDCEEKIKMVASKFDQQINNLSEIMNEFGMNINRRLDEFISNHQAVTRNIEEIRKLKLEINLQKAEIKEVLNDYKAFTEGNTGEIEEVSQTSKREKVSLQSHKAEIIDIKMKLNELESKQQKDTNYEEIIKNLETIVTRLEGVDKHYSPVIPRNEVDDHSIEKERDLLICMDSNSKYINFRKLWTTRNSERKRCYTLAQLHQVILNSDIKTLHHILINIGVNDTDTKSGVDVFEEIKDNIGLIKRKYPDIKIILCELTPRKDERDVHVIEL